MDIEAPVEGTPNQAPIVKDSFSAWTFLKENFTVLSGVAVVSGITLAIVFLFAYLSTFSWHLIEFIQYVDVITFGLIAVGVVSGSFITIVNAAESWLRWKALKTKGERQFAMIVVSVIGAVLFGAYIWAEIKGNTGYVHAIFGIGVLFMAVIEALMVVRNVNAGGRVTARQIAHHAVGAVFLTVFAGRWLAYTVQDGADFDQDIITQNSEFKSAKIVIVMARFTALLQDKTLYIVPTNDITEFRTIQPLNIIARPVSPEAATSTPILAPQAAQELNAKRQDFTIPPAPSKNELK